MMVQESINISNHIIHVCTKPTVMDYMKILTVIIVPVLFGLIMIMGFIGNLLVIIVIIANIQMRNTTNILIISLAVADILFIIFCVPFTAVMYVTEGWPLGPYFCQIYQYMIYITAYCSVYTLVLMSIDRYLAVVHPIRSMTLRNSRNAIFAVAGVWGVFLTANLPLLLHSGVIQGPRDEVSNCLVNYCTYKPLMILNKTTGRYQDNYFFGKIYYTLFFTVFYILPLIIIIVLYGFLINKLLCGRTAKISHSSEAMSSKKRVTKMVVVVIVVFALCWGPIQCIFIIQLYIGDPGGNLFRTFHVIGNCLAYFNSMVNPILYAFLSENFRRAFANFLCCRKLQNLTSGTLRERRGVTNDYGTSMVNTTAACRKRDSANFQQKVTLVDNEQSNKVRKDSRRLDNADSDPPQYDAIWNKNDQDVEKIEKLETVVLLETHLNDSD